MTMARTRKSRKRKGKIKFTQSVRLKQKSDKTRVDIENGDTAGLRKAPARLYPDNGANFKIKIRRK